MSSPKIRAAGCLAAVTVLLAAQPAAPAQAAASRLVVDLAAGTGALRYGATGFLYGLGDEGIPNETMLAALKPQVTAQKAPDGLQHPNGDALRIAPMFKRAGGRDIQIYLQDVYQQWPYEDLGIADYLAKVDTITRKVVADPYRGSYVYVPFNEPDGIWYVNDVAGLNADWKTVYQRIRSIDPGARIAGPNFASYRSADIRSFLTAARDGGVLPDVMTWHELGNDFFTDWDNHYNDYRAMETSLGISPRPITINEYGRFSGDLGVPGNLVQFVAKFEKSKVDGCLAYWTTAGGLNDLVTRNNQATGAWWLYKWYGELTGSTVAVTPPSVSGSLQGVAALDPAKKQARVVFGGNNPASGSYDTDVVVTGLGSAAYLGTTVHASVWAVDTSGLNPSTGPYLVREGDYAASGGQVTVPLTGLKGSSAYQVVVTPNTDLSTVGSASRYEAEYARTDGSARITYGTNTGYSGTYFVEGYGASTTASTKFVVTAPADGYYNLGLRYSAGPYTGAPADRSVRVRLNGADLTDLALPGTANWNTWNTVTRKVFLTAGINRVDVNAYATDDRDAVNLDYLDVAATTGTVTTYEAEAAGNTLSGTAVATSDTAASGGRYVGYVGAGPANTLRVTNVTAPAAGRYRMVVGYANGELGAGATNYNSNIVDRYGEISVNGGTAKRLYFRNTLGWSNYRTTVTDVDLAAGTNSITFGNASTGYAPNIDLIRIAAPLG
ncbi:dockerin [Actinoplanes sp. ATCC 53533]|uniref:carbohydrate-binding protein n=1 Tax=Actinoplanes sp. ATCC 53533 TaxID=1288362 RepID=UPI000F76D22C|nr:CBM35 domain-containing protein [Actinoplanes sp. ATCC 53533]RSM70737.1 dockerin [Actinoplanes sp. ATCC 53533]